jgi:hypothetical protein
MLALYHILSELESEARYPQPEKPLIKMKWESRGTGLVLLLKLGLGVGD